MRSNHKVTKNGAHSTMYMINGDKYVGEWRDDKKHGISLFSDPSYLGKGTYIKKNDGSVYEGEWEDDEKCGYGTLSICASRNGSPSKLYAGAWKNNQFNGFGTSFYKNGGFYEGDWKDNRQEGWGSRIYTDGSRYDGEWHQGKRHGQGILIHANKNRYEGMWLQDEKEGPGRFLLKSKGQVLEGEWSKGVARCGTLMSMEESAQRMPSIMLENSELVLANERDLIVAERLKRLTIIC